MALKNLIPFSVLGKWNLNNLFTVAPAMLSTQIPSLIKFSARRRPAAILHNLATLCRISPQLVRSRHTLQNLTTICKISPQFAGSRYNWLRPPGWEPIRWPSIIWPQIEPQLYYLLERKHLCRLLNQIHCFSFRNGKLKHNVAILVDKVSNN